MNLLASFLLEKKGCVRVCTRVCPSSTTQLKQPQIKIEVQSKSMKILDLTKAKEPISPNLESNVMMCTTHSLWNLHNLNDFLFKWTVYLNVMASPIKTSHSFVLHTFPACAFPSIFIFLILHSITIFRIHFWQLCLDIAAWSTCLQVLLSSSPKLSSFTKSNRQKLKTWSTVGEFTL